MNGNKICNCGSGLESWELLDARGIYCARVCMKCKDKVKSSFRPDIFTDSTYWHDEPIEED